MLPWITFSKREANRRWHYTLRSWLQQYKEVHRSASSLFVQEWQTDLCICSRSFCVLTSKIVSSVRECIFFTFLWECEVRGRMLLSPIVDSVIALFNALDLKLCSFLPFLQGPKLQRETAATKNDTFKPFKYTTPPNTIRNQLECCVNPLNDFRTGFGCK